MAAALNLPIEEKQVLFTGKRWLPNWLSGRTRATLDVSRSSPLDAPWPDAIIAVGYRSVPIARWVQRQSGGRTRLIHIGRPRAPLSWFDLLITTPQYDLPARPNVVHRTRPVQARADDSIDAHETGWDSRLRPDEGPLVAVMIGGDAMPFVLDAASADALADGVIDLSDRVGGHLAVTCGHRVKPPIVDLLRGRLGDHATLFHAFDEADAPNPYRALLSLADAYVITTDSVSMMADAAATGRPIHLFEPTQRYSGRKGLVLRLGLALERVLPSGIRNALIARGIVVPVRKTERVSAALIKSGRARPLGDTGDCAPQEPQSEVDGALLRRIHDLIQEPTP